MELNQAKDLVQKEVLRTWWENNCIGTAECATGFGKSRIGVLASTHFSTKIKNCKVLIIVPTDALKNEWKDEFKKWKAESIFENNVQVECINTARKFKNHHYDLVIADRFCSL